MGRSIIRKPAAPVIKTPKEPKETYRCIKCQKDLAASKFYTFTPDGRITPYCKECLIRMCLNTKGEFDYSLLKEAMQLVNKPVLYSKFIELKSDKDLTEVEKAQRYFHFLTLKINQNLTWLDSKDETYIDSIQVAKIKAGVEEAPAALCVDDELTYKWHTSDKEKISWLEREFKEWATSYVVEGKAQRELVQQICLLKWDIASYQRRGLEVPDSLYKNLSKLLGDAGLKPIQETENGADTGQSFGMMIKMIEENEPILPLTTPDWFDELQLTITGQIAKMMGLHNSVTQKYEEYLSGYSVKEIEALFNDTEDESDIMLEEELEEKLAGEQ